MKAHLNDKEIHINSEEELSDYLEKIDSTEHVEAWFFSPEQSSICLLKNGGNTFLMYLRYPEDIGFVSDSQCKESGCIEYTLANGQVDEYPLSWCIDKEWAYMALAYFYVNSGEQSPYINWQVA